jgi:hypothetical protein
MTQEELKQAITEPAKKVGLEVERELVTQMIGDVEGSPGSLPLLEYTLTELWQQRTVERLTLLAYTRLGGVKGTLQKRATEVYESLSSEEKQAAKRIFLELTQLGEGTEDTRRQVFKRDLVTSKQSEALVERVIQRLADAKLVVTSEVEKGSESKALLAFWWKWYLKIQNELSLNPKELKLWFVSFAYHHKSLRAESNRVVVVDVAHEALIRYWLLLRQWVNENRDAIRKKRQIEEDAQEWQDQRKSGDYLLQGSKLAEAENFLQRYADSVPLSSLGQEFVRVSQAERDRRRTRLAFMVSGLVCAAFLVTGGFAQQQQQSKQTIEAVFLGANTTKILSALPSLLQTADTLRDRQDVNALAYYRRIREEAVKLLRIIQVNRQPDRKFSVSQLELKEILAQELNIKKISDDSEEALAEIIQEKLLPTLEKELQNFNKSSNDTHKQNALQATYAILMQDSGAGADLNGSSSIDSPVEAEQMPCETLKQIAKLWHQYTQNRCGWYGLNSPYEDSLCNELNRQTLTTSIFDFPYDYAIHRINFCQANLKLAQQPI